MFPQKLRCAVLAAAALVGGQPHSTAADSADTAPLPPEVAAAVQVAGAPIPLSADTRTVANFTWQRVEWHKRIMLPPLEAAAKGQPWEAEARKFVEDALPVWLGVDQEDKAQVWNDLAARGDALVNSGCEEPTVLFLAARFKVKGGRNKEEISPRYQHALDLLLADPRYRKAFACIVAVNLSAMLPAPTPSLSAKILELRRAGFEEGSYRGQDDAFFVDQVLSEFDPLRNDLVAKEKLVTALKDLPEWARDTVLGNIEIARAWRARGGGYADTVTPEGWKEYQAQMEKARGHLETAWKQRPDQPYAAADMIRVAMDSGPGSAANARLWFDRTVKARFDYLGAYGTYKFSLLPRWGGTYQQMLAFGLACAGTKRFDTEVPRQFTAVVNQICGDTHQLRDIYEVPEIARALVAVDQGYITAASRPNDRDALISNLVVDAWLGRQWHAARKALDQVPGQNLSPAALSRANYLSGNVHQLVGEILINTSAASEEYGKARELEKQGRYEEAAALYPAVLKASGGEPAVKEFIASLRRTDTVRAKLEDGQWADISHKAAAWGGWGLPNTARWSFPREGALAVDGLGQNTIAAWRGPVGENYEVRATFEFLGPPERPHRFVVVLGLNDRHPAQAVYCDIYTKSLPKGTVRLLRTFDVAGNPDYDVELRKKNQVHIQCWHGQLSLYLNGKTVFEKVRSADGNPSDRDGEIGLAAFSLPQGEGFEVTDMAMRVLKAAPKPPDDGEGQ